MTYNEYKIVYKIVGVRLVQREKFVFGINALMNTIRDIKKDMCCGLEIYLVKLRNIPVREKPVYQYLWI